MKKLKGFDRAERVGRMIRFRYTNGEPKLFARVSGGLAWPTLEAPAYFTIFAQREEKNSFGKRPLIQVCEFEDIEGSVDSFFKQVKKAAEYFKARLIYGNVEDSAFYGKAKSYGLYMPQKLTGMNDFNYGLKIIKTWSNSGGIETMEDSILRLQLSSLRESELKEAPVKFNTINGLRFIVTGVDDREDGRPLSDSPLGGLDVEDMCV